MLAGKRALSSMTIHRVGVVKGGATTREQRRLVLVLNHTGGGAGQRVCQ
jgi:hypothetical protein